jgi:hypothetical protein
MSESNRMGDDAEQLPAECTDNTLLDRYNKKQESKKSGKFQTHQIANLLRQLKKVSRGMDMI